MSHFGRNVSLSPPTSSDHIGPELRRRLHLFVDDLADELPANGEIGVPEPGDRAASRAARTSAQPRYVPSASRSDMPSVNESPTATRLV